MKNDWWLIRYSTTQPSRSGTPVYYSNWLGWYWVSWDINEQIQAHTASQSLRDAPGNDYNALQES